MAELKPCPFCGGEAGIGYGRTEDGGDIVSITVLCAECHIGIFRYNEKPNEYDGFKSEKQAIKAWNRRAEDG